jgi:hypothetical protein
LDLSVVLPHSFTVNFYTTVMLTRGVNSIAFIVLAVLFFHGSVSAQIRRDQKEMGVIDARKWNFANERLPLSGYWTFFRGKLIEPQAIVVERGAFVHFPKLFNDLNANGNGVGCATFHLVLLLPDSIHDFSLEIPQLYNSYKLWADNELIASAGQVGVTRENSSPKWCYQRVTFRPKRDRVNLTLQISNFYHYKGGAKEVIYLGAPEVVNKHWIWSLSASWIQIGFLFLEFVVFMILYIIQPKRAVLFFALLCFVWAVRAAFSNQYPVTIIFPNFNWTSLVKIEYMTLYLAVIFSILFLDQVFKNFRTSMITYLLVGINAFFILFTLFSSPLTFTRWINVYLTVAGLTIGYGTIIVIRALLFDQAGAWFLMVSLLCGAAVFGYDLVSYGSASGYNYILLHGGYILIFLLITTSLLFHLGILKSNSKRTDILTYNEMFKSETVSGKAK